MFNSKLIQILSSIVDLDELWTTGGEPYFGYFKKLGKVVCTFHSNTIYLLFLSKPKPKLVIVDSFRDEVFR